MQGVDPNHFAENRREALRVACVGNMTVGDVIGRTAIAKRRREQAIGGEVKTAAVVVELRFVESEHLAVIARVANIQVIQAGSPLGDDSLAVGRGAGREWRHGEVSDSRYWHAVQGIEFEVSVTVLAVEVR